MPSRVPWIYPLGGHIVGYKVSLRSSIVWAIRELRLHENDKKNTLEFNIKLDGRPLFGMLYNQWKGQFSEHRYCWLPSSCLFMHLLSFALFTWSWVTLKIAGHCACQVTHLAHKTPSCWTTQQAVVNWVKEDCLGESLVGKKLYILNSDWKSDKADITIKAC